jgi:hypothetical protein
VITFFNVSVEDFNSLTERKFPRLTVRKLLKTQKFPFDREMISSL